MTIYKVHCELVRTTRWNTTYQLYRQRACV